MSNRRTTKGAAKKRAATKAAGQEAVDIHGKAMLVSLSVSTWTARRFDKKVTDKVNQDHAAAADVGRYNKHLLGGKEAAKSHAALLAAAGAARTVHYDNTLPWTDEGWRLLPSANFFAYTDAVRVAQTKFDAAVAEFVDDYPGLREQAKVLLNGLYNADDYPPVEAVRGRFRMAVDYSPLPAAGDFRLDLPDDQVAAIGASVEDRVAKATEVAMADLGRRLHEVVARFVDRLGDPEAITRRSILDNAAELVELMTRLNVTEDPALESLRQRVEAELLVHDIDALRDDKDARAETWESAKSIMEAMSGIYGGTK